MKFRAGTYKSKVSVSIRSLVLILRYAVKQKLKQGVVFGINFGNFV